MLHFTPSCLLQLPFQTIKQFRAISSLDYFIDHLLENKLQRHLLLQLVESRGFGGLRRSVGNMVSFRNELLEPVQAFKLLDPESLEMLQNLAIQAVFGRDSFNGVLSFGGVGGQRTS